MWTLLKIVPLCFWKITRGTQKFGLWICCFRIDFIICKVLMFKIEWKFMTIQKNNSMNQSLWNYCLYIWSRSGFYFQNHEFQECYFTIFIYFYMIRVWMHIMHDIGSRCNKNYFLAQSHKTKSNKVYKKTRRWCKWFLVLCFGP
jgi:hypothetical protein